MKIRTTITMIVVRYLDYQTSISANETRCGQADVYYSRADFDKAAKTYGWGDNRAPTEVVKHMGDSVPLFDVLVGSMDPVRVRSLF